MRRRALSETVKHSCRRRLGQGIDTLHDLNYSRTFGFNRLTSLQHFRRIIVCWLIDKVLHKNDVVLKCLPLE